MAIALTTGPTNLRIYQRSNVSGRSSIKLVGTYVGSGTSVQYKITEGARVVQDWKTLGAVSVSSGSFSGYLINVPCGSSGSWYSLDLKVVDAAGATIDSGTIANWSVGVGVLGTGQSLLSEWNTNGAGAVWQDGTSVADETGAYTQPVAGQGATKFCSELSNLIGVPVALINLAVSGSALRKKYLIATGYWWPADATSHTVLLAKAFHDNVDEIELIIWCHGETDAVQANLIDSAGKLAGSEYSEALNGLIDEMYSMFGAVFIYTIPIGRIEIGAAANREHAEVRKALGDRATPLMRYAATHYDLAHQAANTDIYHLTSANYEILATRAAYQIAYNHYGRKDYGRVSGPYISSALFPDSNDRTIVDVFVKGIRNGLEFKDGSASMSHWLRHGPDETALAAPTSVVIFGNVIRLTFAAAFDVGDLISYCYGTGIATSWNTGGVQDDLNVGTLTGIPMQTQSAPILVESREL